MKYGFQIDNDNAVRVTICQLGVRRIEDIQSDLDAMTQQTSSKVTEPTWESAPHPYSIVGVFPLKKARDADKAIKQLSARLRSWYASRDDFVGVPHD